MGTKKERLSIERVIDPQVQETARKLEQLILDYRAELGERKRLDNNRRDIYIERLKVITGYESQSTLSKLVKGYTKYEQDHPDEPAINYLIPNRGRPRQNVITKEQERFIIAAYISRVRKSQLSTGDRLIIDYQPQIEEVQNLVKATFPDYQQDINWLKRFLRNEEALNPSLFDVLRSNDSGELDTVFTNKLGKKVNTAPEEEEWWQSDGVRLSTPVRIDDFACHLDFVSVMDHKSGFLLAYRLVPTKKRDSKGELIKVAFTNHDVRIVLTLSMIMYHHLAHVLYTDHGGQYEQLNLFLLSNKQKNTMRHIQSRRRSPSGRGKGERMHGLLDYMAPRLPGYRKKGDSPFPRYLTKKMIAGLCGIDAYAIEIDEAVKAWNNQPVGGYESRYAMWKASNKTFLPVPSPVQLGLFTGFHTFEENVPLHKDGIHRENTIWQNIWSDKEAYLRFSNVVTAHIPFCTLMLNNTLRGFGLLCSDYGWEEFIPKTENAAISGSRYDDYQKYARESMLQQQRSLLDDLDKILLERFGEIPAVGLHDAQPRVVNNTPEQPQPYKQGTSEGSTTADIPSTTPVSEGPVSSQAPSSVPLKKATFVEQLQKLREQQGQ